MPHLDSFSGRLKDARKAKKLSGQWMVNYLNGYLASCGLSTVSLTTYYSWEKIGTSLEIIKGKSYPHPLVYRLLLIPLGITGYWLFRGDRYGDSVRLRDELRSNEKINYKAELDVTGPIDYISNVEIEAMRVFRMMSPAQKQAAIAFLKTIR